MKYTHVCEGTCSRAVSFEIDGGKLKNVAFMGGCNGNTQGLCALLEGMDAADARNRLSGIRCGNRPTSCPDQLSRAIATALSK